MVACKVFFKTLGKTCTRHSQMHKEKGILYPLLLPQGPSISTALSAQDFSIGLHKDGEVLG